MPHRLLPSLMRASRVITMDLRLRGATLLKEDRRMWNGIHGSAIHRCLRSLLGCIVTGSRKGTARSCTRDRLRRLETEYGETELAE